MFPCGLKVEINSHDKNPIREGDGMKATIKKITIYIYKSWNHIDPNETSLRKIDSKLEGYQKHLENNYNGLKIR